MNGSLVLPPTQMTALPLCNGSLTHSTTQAGRDRIQLLPTVSLSILHNVRMNEHEFPQNWEELAREGQISAQLTVSWWRAVAWCFVAGNR